MTRIAALQFKAQKDQPEASLAALCNLIDQAAAAGAELVVCPEMAYTGYLFENAAAILPRCEPMHGGACPRLSELAARHGIYLVCGYPEIVEAEVGSDSGEAASPRLYNSARVFSPDGALLCNYRKRLLFTADTTWAAAGDTPYPILPTPFGRLTVGICMDLNDDRFTEFLVREGPLCVAFCTNWLDEGHDVLPYYCYRLRGFVGTFIAANTYGLEISPGHAPTRFCGRSTILSIAEEDPPASDLQVQPDPGADDGLGDDAELDASWARTRITIHGRARKSGDGIVLVEI